ncbi:hypothetical protein DIPPA_26163 [Diplonema papillatum]|nr:hypothetical protein DIPPA_24536 [Diplonema papillatum]KAJ9443934.1 hypothetical protein DIPPA_26163 [Diplonema papillatum]
MQRLSTFRGLLILILAEAAAATAPIIDIVDIEGTESSQGIGASFTLPLDIVRLGFAGVVEPEVPPPVAGKPYYHARFKFRSKISHACDATRPLMLRDGSDVLFEISGDNFVVRRRSIGASAWSTVCADVRQITYDPRVVSLSFFSASGASFILSLNRVSMQGVTVISKLACFGLAMRSSSGKFDHNLPPPPLYDRIVIGQQIANIISRSGDGVQPDPAVSDTCTGAQHVRLVDWTWTGMADSNESFMHENLTSVARFELCSPDNDSKMQWMQALQRKAVLLEANPHLCLVPGSLEDVSEWENAVPTTVDRNFTPSDDGDELAWYVKVVIIAVSVLAIGVAILVFVKARHTFAEARNEPAMSPKAHSAQKEVNEKMQGAGGNAYAAVLPPVAQQVSLRTRSRAGSTSTQSATVNCNVDKNPIDTLMHQVKPSNPSETRHRHRSEASSPTDATFSDAGPALRQARMLTAEKQHPAANHRDGGASNSSRHQHPQPLLQPPAQQERQPEPRDVDLVPGPGWESTMDGTDVSEAFGSTPVSHANSFSPSLRQTPTHPRQPYTQNAYRNSSGTSTESEYCQ